jgi:hypothetical protein
VHPAVQNVLSGTLLPSAKGGTHAYTALDVSQ